MSVRINKFNMHVLPQRNIHSMSTFEDRRKNLFEHLNAAEQNAVPRLQQQNEFKRPILLNSRREAKRIKTEMRQFRGKESIFKRPEATISQCLQSNTTTSPCPNLKRSAPTFRKNPNKWKYYNLEHITEKDLSDSTNTATGLAFMKELEERARKQSGDVDMEQEDEDDTGKPVFKQPSAQKLTTIKKKQTKKIVVVPEEDGGDTTVEKSNKKLRLDHLFEDEFED